MSRLPGWPALLLWPLLAAPLGAGELEPVVQPVELNFRLLSGGREANCTQALAGLTGPGAPVALHDARFYISEAALLDAQGQRVAIRLHPSVWQNDAVTLLDFEDGNGSCKGGSSGENRQLRGSVPAGDYRGLTFTVGVPAGLNHSDPLTAAPPLDVQAMGWSWQMGRKFIKVEVAPGNGVQRPGGGKAALWTVHLGSTGCPGNAQGGPRPACRNSNRVTVTLAAFDPARQAVGIDLDALFAGSRLDQDQGMAAGCMSAPGDPECPPLFHALGLGEQAPAQAVFVAVPERAESP